MSTIFRKRCGVQVLDALELGTERAIDLHLHFLRPGNFTVADHGVREVGITGTQDDVKWFVCTIRYANEEGHAMQRTASQPVLCLQRLCHPRFGWVVRFTRLAGR